MGGTETPSVTMESVTRVSVTSVPRPADLNNVISTRAGTISGLVRMTNGSRPVMVPGPTNQNSLLGGSQRARAGAWPGASATVTVALRPAAAGPPACTASGIPPCTWTDTPRTRA